MSDNTNQIVTNGFSSEATRQMYEADWPDEPGCRAKCSEGVQCGGCSFFAKFNYDWGLCCHAGSRHHLETVFEHFYCPTHVDEGWGPHSFTTSLEIIRLFRTNHRKDGDGEAD